MPFEIPYTGHPKRKVLLTPATLKPQIEDHCFQWAIEKLS